VLFNIRGALRTVENACPHNEASPADGQLEGGAASLPCPRPSF
jgi:nitrite reductase/ring-hydroxylating ferredoxin subunit